MTSLKTSLLLLGAFYLVGCQNKMDDGLANAEVKIDGKSESFKKIDEYDRRPGAKLLV